MKPTDERISWLLDSQTPSIVYQTLSDPRLCSPPAARVRAAKARGMRTGAIPAILSRQSKQGNWKIDFGYYGPKYFSTHWSMMLLAELGAERADARFRRGAGYMLEATRGKVQAGLESESFPWSCLFGNILRYAWSVRAAEDDRLERLTRFCARAVSDGDCACGWNGGKACAWGVARVLWGLAAIPKPRRDRNVEAAVRKGVNFLLRDHHLERADYPVPRGGRVSPLWFKLNFPLFYQADILFTLRVLDELEFLDHRGARPALDWLESRRRPDGRWKGSSPFRTRTWREMGAPPETDRWVTLQALRILRHAGRADA
ncbi:MAG: hypothetical protein JW929_13395 [Anaerolineales bacterium]|nr:hypothetical protein [Anaerolineales bacterium]